MKTIEVPITCRTKIGDIPEDMMIGIKVTGKQLQQFASLLGKKYIDEVIPLSKPVQIVVGCSLNHEKNEMVDKMVYWKTPDGDHGWCCSECGKVLQWG
jgi:hypothetical protein